MKWTSNDEMGLPVMATLGAWLTCLLMVTAGCQFDPIAHVTAKQSCGNGTVDPGEACDGPNLGGQTCEGLGFGAGVLVCGTDCHGFVTTGCGTPATCGNGVRNPPEVCDGQDLGGQTCESLGLGQGQLACTSTCRWDTSGCASSGICGNGTLEPPEQCDDGNTQDGDGCSSTCEVEFCGDGTVQAGLGEECDDGNANSGDGCSSTCKTEFCGDGVLQQALQEECDDGNTQDGDGCSSTCKTEGCGDGVVQSSLGEECDDGNTQDDDGCSSTCKTEFCGDGVAQVVLNEECDQNDFAVTCDDFEWMGTGTPFCDDNCHVDLSGCTNRPIGAPCDRHDQCAGGMCVGGQLFPGGYCSQDCSQSDCPTGSQCRQFSEQTVGTVFVCVFSCTNADQCRTGYECYDNYCINISN